jgi:ADP-ribose pyrophosphatase
MSDEREPGRVKRVPVYRGRIVDLSVDTVRFPDGSVGDLEFIAHAGASCVLPVVGRLDQADPDILLLRQYRYAAGGFMWEVPAGMPDRLGEPWDECARRELEEETGWKPGTLEALTRIHTTPGFSDEVIHLWVASDLEPGTAHLDDDEFVEVVQMPLSEALEMVRDGTITDCKSVATLLYAARFVIGPAAGSRRDGRVAS